MQERHRTAKILLPGTAHSSAVLSIVSVLIFKEGDLTAKAESLGTKKVKDIMTRSVITVTEDVGILEIAGLMTECKIKQVPVTRGGRLVGIIRRYDIVKAIARKAKDLQAGARGRGENDGIR